MSSDRLFELLRDADPACWNELREREPDTPIQLGSRNLSGQRLAGLDLHDADLRDANLSGADLRGANLRCATLESANLEGADLTGAILSRAEITRTHMAGARLTECSLTRAHVSAADLSNAHLDRAILYQTTLRQTRVDGADFNGCRCRETTFLDVDLSGAQNLDRVRHEGPVVLDFRTFAQGPLPEEFLRDCGVPHELVAAIRTSVRPSCFISYTKADVDLATRLQDDLGRAGVQAWLAARDLQGGGLILERVDEVICNASKTVVLISEASSQSSWVQREVRMAHEEERTRGLRILIPVLIEKSVEPKRVAWVKDLLLGRVKINLSDWRDPATYAAGVEELSRAVRTPVLADGRQRLVPAS